MPRPRSTTAEPPTNGVPKPSCSPLPEGRKATATERLGPEAREVLKGHASKPANGRHPANGDGKPVVPEAPADPPDRRARRARRDLAHRTGRTGLLAKVYAYLAGYLVMPETTLLAVSAWVMAAWLTELWDRFPHLAIASPVERCGKTRLLELLEQVCPNAKLMTSASSASLYRRIEKTRPRPTVLLDEAQGLSRKGSERSEELRELFCGSIGKNATVSRCVGQNHEPHEFPAYCPKVIALIGKPERVLADRSLPVPLKRKKVGEKVRRCRLRMLEKYGGAIRTLLENWSKDEGANARVAEEYRTLGPFDIDNDRMAELLLPLAAVLKAEGQAESLKVLETYAHSVEKLGREAEALNPGVLLLAACREIYAANKWAFGPTEALLTALADREEEPWGRWCGGERLTPESLRNLLVDYGIRPKRDRGQTCRGYYASDFHDAWSRYLPG